ncbi:MAG: hypothetical protein FJX69_05480, partial [Alphaproteobacteria bacterium]|nr:hypothetical protein [Alphaproteobacteria bacterium]
MPWRGLPGGRRPARRLRLGRRRRQARGPGRGARKAERGAAARSPRCSGALRGTCRRVGRLGSRLSRARCASRADRRQGRPAPAQGGRAERGVSIHSRRDAQAVPQASDGIADRVRAWAVALVGDRRFRRLATAFPLSRPFARREARAVFDLCAGFVYSQVLLACVRLGVLDRLHESPRTPSDIASATGLEVVQAQRLLDAAAALALARRRRDGRYALAARGAVVRGDPGLVEMVEHHALVYRDLADPVALLRGDATSASLRGYWGYARAEDPTALTAADVAPYSRLMSLSQPPVAEEIVAAYPFERHARVLDLGGGEGTFLRVVARRHPALDLELFDLPAVAARAQAACEADGLAARIRCHAGDFRTGPVPEGADLVTLIRILHDHEDDAVLRIL